MLPESQMGLTQAAHGKLTLMFIVVWMLQMGSAAVACAEGSVT